MSLDGVVDSLGGGPGEEHRSGGWAVKDLEFVPEAWSFKGEELTATPADVYQRPRGVLRVLIWFPRVEKGANPTLSPTAPQARRHRDR